MSEQCIAKREKTWDEMDDGQKMSAMRREIQRLSHVIQTVQMGNHIARHHYHAPDGRVLVAPDGVDDRLFNYSWEPLK
jgi:hypothetical protein